MELSIFIFRLIILNYLFSGFWQDYYSTVLYYEVNYFYCLIQQLIMLVLPESGIANIENQTFIIKPSQNCVVKIVINSINKTILGGNS